MLKPQSKFIESLGREGWRGGRGAVAQEQSRNLKYTVSRAVNDAVNFVKTIPEDDIVSYTLRLRQILLQPSWTISICWLFYTEEDGSHSWRLNKFTAWTVAEMRGRLTSVKRHRSAITFTHAVNKYRGQPDIGNSNRGIRKISVDYNDVHASSHAMFEARILQRPS